MGRAFVCFRYFLVAGAIILGISGVIVSICAGYFIYQLYEYAPLTPDKVCESSATLLAMGIITSIVGWCTCQFLNFSNRGQVISFAVVLSIISLIETIMGIWTLVRYEQIDTLPAARLQEIFALAVTDEKPIWEHMQSKLHCCGIDGPSDYRAQQSIPWSCCNTTNSENDDSANVVVCATNYSRGCQHVVINRTKSILLHVFLLSLCSVLLQVAFIACTTCYARIYKDKIDRRAQLEIAKRASIHSAREPDTKDILLARQSKYLSDAIDS